MEQKVYKTKSKAEIMDYVNSLGDKRFSAADMIKCLKEQGSTVNPTTVYRNLEKLTESGALIRYKTNDSDSVQYQAASKHSNCKNHLHMQCSKCGSLIHLECHFMDEISEHLLKDHGFMLQCEGSVLMGICKKCQVALV